MPRKDGTGPDGNGPKKDNKGTPTPRRDGSGGGRGGGNKRTTTTRRGGNKGGRG